LRRRQRAEGSRQKAEGRGQGAAGRKQRAGGSRQRARAEGRWGSRGGGGSRRQRTRKTYCSPFHEPQAMNDRPIER